jgi:hypothetical protein
MTSKKRQDKRTELSKSRTAAAVSFSGLVYREAVVIVILPQKEFQEKRG